MQRNKTQRRRVAPTPTPDIQSGPFIGDKAVAATEDSLDALFAAESETTFHQPWQKLDRGSRLDRLRKYVQGYPDLTPAERASLLAAVLQAFELRQLNTKVAVEYDPATAQVLSIRGLRERTTSSGLKTYRIDSVAARTTLKQPRTRAPAAAAVAAAVASNLNPTHTTEIKEVP